MEDKIKQLKEKIAEAESQLKDPDFSSDAEIVALLNSEIADLNKQLESLGAKTEKAVENAEAKLEQAETKEEKKEAQAELKEAEQQVKEVEKIAEQVEKAENKIEEAKKKGRPKGSKNKASSPKKVRVPKGAKPLPIKRRKKRVVKKKKVAKRKVAPIKKRVMPAKRKPAPVKKERLKSVNAFGRKIEYRNDSEFCKALLSAYKKRKKASRKGGKRRKTKPLFGSITGQVSNAFTKAIYSVPKSRIEKNPKAFLAKAQRLEKSAIRFLEDFKSILGNDYKKSEITSEFGDLEKTIKKFVGKFMKK